MKIITIEISPKLKKIDLENKTSLKDVGLLLGIQYVKKNFNGEKMRVLEGDIEKFVDFLESKIR